VALLLGAAVPLLAAAMNTARALPDPLVQETLASAP